ncbi:peptidase S8/S53 domain-containing protein [Xylaria venustula]|nr:peptidase S8/S53 domain-containing protein [Xylaria venustula]
MTRAATLLFKALLCSSLAFSLPTSEHVVHEKRIGIPEHWTKVSEASDGRPIDLRFALKQSNLERAEEYMREVSHPESENFGRFWTPQDVIRKFAPSEEALSDTVKWLLEMGVASNRIVPSAGRNWIKVKSTVAEAERLLDTTYNVYEDDEGTALVACESYAVPKNIQQHIDFVSPTIQFDPRMGAITKRNAKREAMRPKFKAVNIDSRPLELDSCSELTTPACLRAIYGIPEEGEGVEGNSYGIVEFAPQSYNQVDLNGFFSVYTSNVPNDTAPIFDGIDGGFISDENGSGTRGESNLDLCYAMSLVYPQNVTLYQVGDSVSYNPATNNNFLDAIDGSYCTFEGGDDPVWDAVYPHDASSPGAYTGEPMCGTYEATNVISVSYGRNEGDRPPSYTSRECMEYMKLGLMGVTLVSIEPLSYRLLCEDLTQQCDHQNLYHYIDCVVRIWTDLSFCTRLFSSGDTGVAGLSGRCLLDNGAPTPVGSDYGRFNPLFPASCPWITSVGGSALPANGSVSDREVVAYQFPPGGGFSNVFPLPEYQSAAIASYYAEHDPGYNSSRYNDSQAARGFPDVAVAAQNFVTGIDGGFQAFTGTSAAAPTFGAMITLINGERIKAGKGPVGFLNEVLYAHPEVFDDITEGHQSGCGTEGFQAVDGWDPASGLGAPNFVKLKEVLMDLP